jgi:hypothetical protein
MQPCISGKNKNSTADSQNNNNKSPHYRLSFTHVWGLYLPSLVFGFLGQFPGAGRPTVLVALALHHVHTQ